VVERLDLAASRHDRQPLQRVQGLALPLLSQQGLADLRDRPLEASLAAAIDAALAPEEQLRVLVGVALEKYLGADDAHKVQLVGTAALAEEQREAIRAVERRIVRHVSNVPGQINPGLDNPARPLLTPVTGRVGCLGVP
jgi:hypothetical protein